MLKSKPLIVEPLHDLQVKIDADFKPPSDAIFLPHNLQ
tara:strand:+ start:237 stop:350 length:114 start_codon:yes stop_codon:yes gene_type:complete